MAQIFTYTYDGAPITKDRDVRTADDKGFHSASSWDQPPATRGRTKYTHHIPVTQSSSVASSSSSSSSNDLFPENFDHKRYSSQSPYGPLSPISLERSNSHTKPVFEFDDSSYSHQHNRNHSSSSKHRSRNGNDGLTNGYRDRGNSTDKQGTLRTVSFDSGFDTSKGRLSSLSSDDSTRYREIKPTKSKPPPQNMGKPVEKRFLRKVQRELEDQRHQWESEVDHLTGSLGRMPTPSGSKQQGESSYVDTSGHKPIFKAFVDMTGYPARNMTVNVDNLTNKVIVRAEESPGPNGVTRTFTQKITLPRFADTEALTSRLSKSGTLKIEVPLLYYFPQPEEAKERDRKAKSFVYQVDKPNGDNGPRVLEILVNTGAEFRAKELKVLVEDDSKLVVLGEKQTTDSRGKMGVQRKLIKSYALPKQANVDSITSRLGRDGRLQVNIPLKD